MIYQKTLTTAIYTTSTIVVTIISIILYELQISFSIFAKRVVHL